LTPRHYLAETYFIQVTPTNSPAPALARGLHLLDLLQRLPGASLEQLAREVPYPKPSLFRLLQTLVDCGMVEKSPLLRYFPLRTLQPFQPQADLFPARLEHLLKQLCSLTHSTVEWFVQSEQGLVLDRQEHPDSEIRVFARPGFLREWQGEFDAIAMLGYAFAPLAPMYERGRAYIRNGSWEALTPNRARLHIERARDKGVASDLAFNANGIRRTAAAIFAPDWRGILSIAIAYRFDRNPPPEALETQLLEAIPTLQPTQPPPDAHPLH